MPLTLTLSLLRGARGAELKAGARGAEEWEPLTLALSPLRGARGPELKARARGAEFNVGARGWEVLGTSGLFPR